MNLKIANNNCSPLAPGMRNRFRLFRPIGTSDHGVRKLQVPRPIPSCLPTYVYTYRRSRLLGLTMAGFGIWHTTTNHLVSHTMTLEHRFKHERTNNPPLAMIVCSFENCDWARSKLNQSMMNSTKKKNPIRSISFLRIDDIVVLITPHFNTGVETTIFLPLEYG